MEAPESAADPRPNNEPYFIDSSCPDCSEDLVLYDEYTEEGGEVWYDEWICPSCDDGLHMDWPDSKWERIEKAMQDIEEGNFATLDELEEALKNET